jgi:hypothetical protein
MLGPEESERIRKWFVQNYPTEAVFIDEITKNVNDIYQRAGIRSDFKENEPKSLGFQIIRRKETDYTELQMDVHSMLFLGGMARAISNISYNLCSIIVSYLTLYSNYFTCFSKQVLSAK